MRGAINQYFDVAQIVLYLFWFFFAGLIIYLRREDKREGYPLVDFNPTKRRGIIQGWPGIPSPKIFRLRNGETREAPAAQDPQMPIKATPIGPWPGAPLEPDGNPMLDGVGPASYALRPEVPDATLEGGPRLLPLRRATDFSVAPQDPDPRGMIVLGADGAVGGKVIDLWVDQAEAQFRYFEVEVDAGPGKKHVLLPVTYARVRGSRRQVLVQSILGRHFADVPVLRDPDVVTMREEDRISAYYAGGQLYALASRNEPLL